jgi:hypothetical protein
MHGKYHGYGIQQFSNGSLLRGYWSGGKAEGKGELRYLDGDIFIGTFRISLFNV